MGGYVAMYLARHYPRKIDKVITLATKFKWDEIIAAKETAMLNAGKIEVKIPAFAGTLKKRHYPNDWKIVLHKTAEMLTAMGQKNPLQTEDLKKIEHPVLIMLGDKDKMVSREETMEVYHQLPNAQLSILTDTQHPIESVNIERLAFEIKAFLK